MKDIFTYIVVAFMGLVGGGASLYILISLPVMLAWKLQRKIRYGTSMFA